MNAVFKIPSKPSLDLCTTTVTVRKRRWIGGRVGAEGGFEDTDLAVSPTPFVRDLNQREITGSGGRYETGDVKVGPLIPVFPGGGYTPEQLAPLAEGNALEILYVLEGGITGHYKRIDIETDRALSYWLVLRRKRSSP
jgi:hypothetical protein